MRIWPCTGGAEPFCVYLCNLWLCTGWFWRCDLWLSVAAHPVLNATLMDVGAAPFDFSGAASARTRTEPGSRWLLQTCSLPPCVCSLCGQGADAHRVCSERMCHLLPVQSVPTAVHVPTALCCTPAASLHHLEQLQTCSHLPDVLVPTGCLFNICPMLPAPRTLCV